jgi:hypothetical protein
MGSVRRKSRSSASSKKPARRNYLLCLDDKGYPTSLETRKVYRAVVDAKAERRGFVRVVDDSGDDYLYPRRRFVAIDLPRGAKKLFKNGAERT